MPGIYTKKIISNSCHWDCRENSFKLICRASSTLICFRRLSSYYWNKDSSPSISYFQKTSLPCTYYQNKEFTMHLFLEKPVGCLFVFSVILEKNWNIWSWNLASQNSVPQGEKVSISSKMGFYTWKNCADIENVISNPILNRKLQLTVKMNVFHSSFLWLSLPKQQLGKFLMERSMPFENRNPLYCLSDFWVPENYY